MAGRHMVKKDMSREKIPQPHKTESGQWRMRGRHSPYVDGYSEQWICATKPTIAEVNVEYRRKLDELLNNIVLPPNEITLDAFVLNTCFPKWLKERNTGSSILNYKKFYCGNVQKAIGKMPMQDITSTMLDELVQGMENRIGVGSIDATIGLLKRVFREAKRQKIVNENPAEDLTRISKTKSKAACDLVDITKNGHRALVFEEQKIFFEAAKGTWYENAHKALCYSGMRCGELCALTWDRVYPQYILIDRTATVDENRRSVIGKPKTERSFRQIPMSRELKETLEAQRAKLESVNKYSSTGFVFPRTNGEMATTPIIEEATRKIIAKINRKGEKIKPFSPHAWRATFCTICADSGMPQLSLMQILGHSNPAMTQRYYRQTTANDLLLMNQVSEYRDRMKALTESGDVVEFGRKAQ